MSESDLVRHEVTGTEVRHISLDRAMKDDLVSLEDDMMSLVMRAYVLLGENYS